MIILLWGYWHAIGSVWLVAPAALRVPHDLLAHLLARSGDTLLVGRIHVPGAIAPLQGRYLGDQDAIRARIEGVKNQTK